jgi:hypothetical protein
MKKQDIIRDGSLAAKAVLPNIKKKGAIAMEYKGAQ